jgi:hypothetical protein
MLHDSSPLQTLVSMHSSSMLHGFPHCWLTQKPG